jgi:hypothetical protein
MHQGHTYSKGTNNSSSPATTTTTTTTTTMAQVGVPYLDIAATSRQPQTDEEHIIIYRLDFEAFRALEASVRSVFRGEDPAYLAFAVRRMFFVQFCKFIDYLISGID